MQNWRLCAQTIYFQIQIHTWKQSQAQSVRVPTFWARSQELYWPASSRHGGQVCPRLYSTTLPLCHMQRNRGKLIKCFINVCFIGWCLTKNPESKPNCQVLSINIIENLRYSFQIPLELSKDALMKPANGVKLKLEKKITD